jgi:serine protease Do
MVTLGRLDDSDEEAAANPDESAPAQEGEQGPVASAAVLGMSIAELDDEARAKYSIAADISGVVITDVAPDSAAAEKGIQPGDVIISIAQESVSTPKEVMDHVAALKSQGRKNALLMLSSKGGALHFETLRVN